MALFGQRKPRQFNYKPIYLKEEDESDFSDEMHKRWNRIPYSQLLKEGKQRVFRTILGIAALLYFFIKLYDYIIQAL